MKSLRFLDVWKWSGPAKGFLGLLVYVLIAAGAGSVVAVDEPVTFTEHIAPILFENCAGCHRPGEAAPFSLLSYADAAKRGHMIAAVTQARYMPPWKAEPGAYPFRGERRLSAEQIELIQRWVDQGMPEGDPARLPRPPEFTLGWQLGEPDLVVELPTGYVVPADGSDIYRNFVVPLNLKEDKWVRAIELRPSARSVVHHVLFFADETGMARSADAADPEPRYDRMGLRLLRNSLGGWAVGQQPYLFPEGIALPLPKGSDLVLQYHFHPSGKAETEKAVVGLHFADKPPHRTLTPIQLPPLFGRFAGVDIPPGERNFQVEDAFELPVDVEAIGVGAHAHYLGKELKMTATFPEGETRTLLWIKDWDFAWQDRYFFRDPVALPKGTRIHATVRWDNSAANPRNPSHPPVRVRWGVQSTDEMGSVTLLVLARRESDLGALRLSYRLHVFESRLRGLL